MNAIKKTQWIYRIKVLRLETTEVQLNGRIFTDYQNIFHLIRPLSEPTHGYYETKKSLQNQIKPERLKMTGQKSLHLFLTSTFSSHLCDG